VGSIVGWETGRKGGMNDADLRRRNHWINHIARHAHAKPEASYLRFEGRSITWSQLHERVNAIAAASHRRGAPRRLVPLRRPGP